MKKIKKTKIVATLGPASSDRDTIKEMMIAGVNVFRINFSHADFDAAKERIELIRDLNKELGYNVGVLADLQGPKLRVGKMKDDVVVEKGDRIVFTTKRIEEGTADHVYVNYQSFPKDVKAGELSCFYVFWKRLIVHIYMVGSTFFNSFGCKYNTVTLFYDNIIFHFSDPKFRPL